MPKLHKSIQQTRNVTLCNRKNLPRNILEYCSILGMNTKLCMKALQQNPSVLQTNTYSAPDVTLGHGHLTALPSHSKLSQAENFPLAWLALRLSGLLLQLFVEN